MRIPRIFTPQPLGPGGDLILEPAAARHLAQVLRLKAGAEVMLFNGNGWLENLGFIDFAGSPVVHSVGGWAALAGAIVLGPRMGKYTKDGRVRPILGHNMALAALGVFILWLGWFGFNPGSTTAANKDIAMIFVNTNLAAAAGAVLAMIVSWIKFGKPEIGMSLNGALAGLVAITSPCATVTPGSAIIIGAIAGGILGHQVGGGSGQVLATMIGTVAGAAIGGSIGRSMDETDRLNASMTLENVRTGVSSSWINPDTGERSPAGYRRYFLLSVGMGIWL